MPVESVTYISDLVATNPIGATDPKSQGDDHIRNIKSAIKTTFPNITGAVTPTHTELNFVDGVTSAIQTQLDTKAAAAALNASALTSGTVPDARFPATLPALNGSALTNLNATNIASGTLAEARFPQPWTSAFLISHKDFTVGHTAQLNATANRGNITANGASSAIFQLGVGATRVGYALHDGSTLTLSNAANGTLTLATNDASVLDFAAGGAVTSPNVAAAVGYKGLPAVSGRDASSPTSSFTLELSHAGKQIALAHGATVTIPPNSTVAFAIGTVIKLYGYAGSGGYTVARGSGVTLYWEGTDFTNADRTMSGGFAVAVLTKLDTNVWGIGGVGIS